MKKTISAILERELNKLDVLSRLSPDPLPPQDVKSLDVLIKALRTFLDPPAPISSSPKNEEGPSLLSEEDLVLGLTPTPPA